MPDIVLKDRDGNAIEHTGVESINLKTVDGGTKEFVDLDSVPQPIEKTIGLDFSSGNMEVSPGSGQVFSKVNIPKPGNLEPDKIAEGVDIAGIVGTLVAGGGNSGNGGIMAPCMFTKIGASVRHQYYSGYQSVAMPVSISIPLNSVLHTFMYANDYVRTNIAGGVVSKQVTSFKSRWPTITEEENEKVLTYSNTVSGTTSTYKYASLLAYAVAVFSMPGIYMYQEEDGTYCIYADETATEFPEAAVPGQTEIAKVDLSNSNITTIPDNAFYISHCREVLMPETVTSVGNFSLDSSFGDDDTIVPTFDFSKHTTVPTATSSNICDYRAVIKVPAALYDEWIAANNWSSIASQIVAV